MAINKVPKDELAYRLRRFTNALDNESPDWELCGITGGVNLYYLTGTICDGLLLIHRGASAILWVRRSYERAMLESEFGDIRHMSSFRDIAANTEALPDTLYLDVTHATLAWYGLLLKHMPFKNVLPADNAMAKTRAVKSEYELAFMRRSGQSLNKLLREDLPALLHDGISETQLSSRLFATAVENGHHGLSRFSGADSILGHIAFADSPLYPSVFDGASGIAGLHPAVPILGSRDVFLRPGDLIYADTGFGFEGYHTDKTLVFSYKQPQSDAVAAAHNHCLELERIAANMLRPGVRPSDIYATIMDALRPEYRNNFMGAPGRGVPFLGHSLGLYLDEKPVIAKGFDDPLELNMTIALEPKIGSEGIGMVGSENTYLVTASGGVSLTGEASEIILLK
ncbi:MAG: M24 family metallopeptidase [Oscillospiraceae bacterium]|nr:M24 family metallopeptidase [Oscillospiraceae bacterium]